MASVAPDHAGKHGAGDEHRRYRIYVHGSYDLVRGLLVEGLVAGDDSGTVDQDVDLSAFAHYSLLSLHNKLISRYIHYISLDLAFLSEFADCISDILWVYIPYDEA